MFFKFVSIFLVKTSAMLRLIDENLNTYDIEAHYEK